MAIFFLLSCTGPDKVVLSRGTTPPRFLRRASLAEVVGYYGRTADEGLFEGTAILMDYAYLRAFARQQGRARFDDAATIRAEIDRSVARYGGERTSFAVRFTMVNDLALRAQDPTLDLAHWSFRLRDGRGAVVRSEAVETLSPQGRTEVESTPTWGGSIAIERHHYQIQGAVKFVYRVQRRVGWISLYAYAPGVDEEPMTFVWILK